jgi:hypothetical protein
MKPNLIHPRPAAIAAVLGVALLSISAISEASESAASFATLAFANRAQCSVLSQSPTRSILIVGDSYDAGRLAFNISRVRNNQSTAVSENPEADSMNHFRRTVGFTASLVIDRLTSGKIPLLTEEFKSLVDQCDHEKRCAPLESEIARLWKNASETAGDQASDGNNVTCLKIDKFSALQSHLNKSKPDLAVLQELGQTLSEKSSAIDCTANHERNKSDRHFLLQVDLARVPENFDKVGFDFWASAKAYISWAWRFAPEVRRVAGKYGDLFASLALEEEVLMVPNGCRSLTLPRCDLQRIAIDAVRELAKPPQAASGFETHFNDGPQGMLLSRGARSVSDGFLGTKGTEAESWVKNFTTRFNEARWVSRNKLQNANRISDLIQRLGTASTFVADLEADIRRYSPVQYKEFAAQLSAICLESKILNDPKFKILKPQFDALSLAESSLDSSMAKNPGSFAVIARSAGTIGQALSPICERLEKDLFSKSPNEYGFLSDWARERMQNLISEKPLSHEQRAKGWNRPEAYLSLKAGKTASTVGVCHSPAACIQMTFKAYADLHYVATWGAALGRTKQIRDANLFNPYAELSTCKIYDPWFAQSQANSLLAQRLVVSALSSAIPLPIFAEKSSKRPVVNMMVAKLNKNSVDFEPQFESEDSKTTFFADLGALTGAPCAVQFSTEAGTPFQVYGVGGVSLNFCSDSRGAEADMNESSEMKSTPIRRSICGGCTVNLVSATATASYAAPTGPWRMLFGSLRAFGLYIDATKDEVNIPRSYTVRPNYVLDAFSENRNSIPASCEASLINGYRCFQDVCAANAAHELETQTGLRANESSIQYDGESHNGDNGTGTGMIGIRVSECDGEINARVHCQPAERKYEVLSPFSSFSRSCTKALSAAYATKKRRGGK